jgi:hypothetical protein
MTEAEWAACTDPGLMLEFLRGWANSRKLCLFACACCRCIWGLMPDQTSRRAVEVAERFADRQATEAEVAAASDAIREAVYVATWAAEDGGEDGENRLDLGGVAAEAADLTARFAAAWATGNSLWADSRTAAEAACIARAAGASGKTQCDLLRCIFGNRLRPGPPVPSDVLRWNDATVRRIAQAIYDERRWGDMPLLGDALLDAGCDNDEVLAHCRIGGEHVRGCWVVDLLLGKE